MAGVDMAAIRFTCRKRLEDTVPEFATLVAEGKVAFDNRKLDPSVGWALWARETLLPASERWSASGLVEGSGLYEMDVIAGLGKGTEEADALTRSMVDAFEPGTHLLIVGTADRYLSIDRAHREPVRQWDQNWAAFPVLVTWRAYEPITTY